MIAASRVVYGASRTRSFLYLWKKLSLSALSQPFPSRLIELAIPYFAELS